MYYKLSEIEDQILATLRANETLQVIDPNIRTHAGTISPQTFLNPAFDREGFINLLPFVYIEYRGRKAEATNTTFTSYSHDLKFRLYVGAQSLREKREAQLSAYDMLAAVYDSINGRYPKCSANENYAVSFLSGTIIQTPFNALSPLRQAEGDGEALIVNIPGIVVYQTDYNVIVMA